MARKQSFSRDTISPNVPEKQSRICRAGDTDTKCRTANPTYSSPFVCSRRNATGRATTLESSLKRSHAKSVSSLKPFIFEQQISVLSTDSGILPKEIQDSSFVDDVIDELNSKGISHSDIIGFQDCHTACKELKPDDPLAFSQQTSDVVCHEHDIDMQPRSLYQRRPIAIKKRQKNNEASRRSRACRKKSLLVKEEEIAKLEEENQRLCILLNDFSAIASSCKQWIVQKMDTSETE